jgi:hypothetical protein
MSNLLNNQLRTVEQPIEEEPEKPPTPEPIDDVKEEPPTSEPQDKPEVKTTETKTKVRVQKLVECPKCKKSLTEKSLRYTHERVCAGEVLPKPPVKRREVKPQEVNETRELNTEKHHHHLNLSLDMNRQNYHQKNNLHNLVLGKYE